MSKDYRVARVRTAELNDSVESYEGSLELVVVGGERARDIRVPFRRESEGGIARAGTEHGPIWRWENPPELADITLAESIGWDLTGGTGGLDIHGYVRGGEWESV